MEVLHNTFTDSNLFDEFWNLYQISFPEYEQRSIESQKSLTNAENYTLLSFAEQETYVGLLTYWDFEEFCYLEHFAINPGLRGKGYGSKIIQYFLKNDSNKLILEIDPIEDDISKKRCRFYERLGFKQNSFDFINPGYKGKKHPHQLTLMSSPEILTEEEYILFTDTLNNIILKY